MGDPPTQQVPALFHAWHMSWPPPSTYALHHFIASCAVSGPPLHPRMYASGDGDTCPAIRHKLPLHPPNFPLTNRFVPFFGQQASNTVHWRCFPRGLGHPLALPRPCMCGCLLCLTHAEPPLAARGVSLHRVVPFFGQAGNCFCCTVYVPGGGAPPGRALSSSSVVGLC